MKQSILSYHTFTTELYTSTNDKYHILVGFITQFSFQLEAFEIPPYVNETNKYQQDTMKSTTPADSDEWQDGHSDGSCPACKNINNPLYITRVIRFSNNT